MIDNTALDSTATDTAGGNKHFCEALNTQADFYQSTAMYNC